MGLDGYQPSSRSMKNSISMERRETDGERDRKRQTDTYTHGGGGREGEGDRENTCPPLASTEAHPPTSTRFMLPKDRYRLRLIQ